MKVHCRACKTAIEESGSGMESVGLGGISGHLAECSECNQAWTTAIRESYALGANSTDRVHSLCALRFVSLEEAQLDPFGLSLECAVDPDSDASSQVDFLELVKHHLAEQSLAPSMLPRVCEATGTLAASEEEGVASLARQLAPDLEQLDERRLVSLSEGKLIRSVSAGLARVTGLLDEVVAILAASHEIALEATLPSPKPAWDADSDPYIFDTDPGRDENHKRFPSPRFNGSIFSAAFLVAFHPDIEPAGGDEMEVSVVLHPPVNTLNGEQLEGVHLPGRLERRPSNSTGRNKGFPWLARFEGIETHCSPPNEKPVVKVSNDMFHLHIVPKPGVTEQ
jgi:hypothetical protein